MHGSGQKKGGGGLRHGSGQKRGLYCDETSF